MHECIKSMFSFFCGRGGHIRVYVFRNAEGVCLICALHLSFGMSLNRQWEGVQDAHEGVEGGGSWGFCSGGFFLVVLDVSGPEPECHIPFSG